jgi:hypothetical protein
MKTAERASQIWSVLAWAATNRQILTYDILGQLIGVPRMGLGKLLEPVQAYCMKHELPPLTVLAVQKDTGLPGSGFIAAADIPEAQMRVFEFDWLQHGCPSVDRFEQTGGMRR